MTMQKTLVSLVMMAVLTACMPASQSTRNATPEFLDPVQPGSGVNAIAVSAAPAELAVVGVEVLVPQSLKVSEANAIVPMADIVWRGDPMGERHTQVQAIFEAAAAQATSSMTTGQPVIATIEVTRFHALTEKARYLTGGNYALHFNLTLRDAASGLVVYGPVPVVGDVKASGGVRAIAEDNAGRTEKVVITERLVYVLQSELSNVTLQTAL